MVRRGPMTMHMRIYFGHMHTASAHVCPPPTSPRGHVHGTLKTDMPAHADTLAQCVYRGSLCGHASLRTRGFERPCLVFERSATASTRLNTTQSYAHVCTWHHILGCGAMCIHLHMVVMLLCRGDRSLVLFIARPAVATSGWERDETAAHPPKQKQHHDGVCLSNVHVNQICNTPIQSPHCRVCIRGLCSPYGRLAWLYITGHRFGGKAQCDNMVSACTRKRPRVFFGQVLAHQPSRLRMCLRHAS
jgi:hypothetical protein